MSYETRFRGLFASRAYLSAVLGIVAVNAHAQDAVATAQTPTQTPTKVPDQLPDPATPAGPEQTAEQGAGPSNESLQEVVVTGYRAALESALELHSDYRIEP